MYMDKTKKLHKVARSIEAGTVEINEAGRNQTYHSVAINNQV